MNPVRMDQVFGSAPSLILFGGGLDSGAMVEMAIAAGQTPTLLFIDYGQKARAGELASLHYFSDKYDLPYHQIEMPKGVMVDSPLTTQRMAQQHADNYMPARNMLFAALALPVALRFRAVSINLGASPAGEDSVYLDAKPAFAKAFNEMVYQGYGPLMPSLVMPLVDLNRVEYLSFALRREPSLFAVTFSCYESTSEQECGECTHCQIKRAVAEQVRA